MFLGLVRPALRAPRRRRARRLRAPRILGWRRGQSRDSHPHTVDFETVAYKRRGPKHCLLHPVGQVQIGGRFP